MTTYARASPPAVPLKVIDMLQRRRASVLALVSLVLSVVVLAAPPADAKRMNLHPGSRGKSVLVLEIRLARLGMLTPSAVDKRYRAATVNAVRLFQLRLGLPATGRVDARTWYAVAAEPGRRARLPSPTVLGHRGQVTTRTGENTLGAMRLAAPYANMLEFDLHLTSDHELVLMHDTTLDRTTNCTGAVSSWTFADLRAQCRVGAQVIPTFDEVAEYAASVGRQIAPELKNARMTGADLTKFVSVVRAHGLAGRTWVQSVFGSHFAPLRELEPRLRMVLVSAGAPAVSILKSLRVQAVATVLFQLTIPRVHAYHVGGIRVWGWTARTSYDLQLAKAIRADAVVTDIPATARALYRRAS
jgi:glycerophosphoryl diester phosphodiesterase